MPRITLDSQSLLIDNRRIWLVGAGIDYARVPDPLWADRIAAARQAGFNTIITGCPWLVHEPRRGRYVFTGQGDVRRFVEECVKAGMYVVLKVGPFIGGTYDGGGLPSWMREIEGIALRESNDAYLERAGLFLRKVLSVVSDLQIDAARPGGIIAVQVEQSWQCSNDHAAHAYLGELARHVRENGFAVPILTANNLWAETPDTIETWTGWDALLAHLRQFRAVHSERPRFVSGFDVGQPIVWGAPAPSSKSADDIVHRLAQTLAAGAQPMVTPFHAGSNFGFLGGRLPGRPDGFIASCAGAGAPLGEAGVRGDRYDRVKRLASFATHFGFVFAELEPDYHPVAMAVDRPAEGASKRATASPVSVVPLRGAQGHVVFVFADPASRDQSAHLLLDRGLDVSVHLGDQGVGWYLVDVDLGGRGRLDFANLCPFALVDRSILVMFGPEKSPAVVSLNDSVIETTVPSGAKPRVIRHQDLTLVICSQQQIDATYVDDKRIYIGAAGLDAQGQPIPRAGYSHITVVSASDESETSRVSAPAPKLPPTKLDKWLASPCDAQADGSSPRFATLNGPETLDTCGAPAGYGWYRVLLKSDSAKKRLVCLPDIGNRLHLFVNGELQAIAGPGPGGAGQVLELKLDKGANAVVGLADHTGRFSDGNDFGRRKGWFGHMYEIKPVRTTRGKVIEGEPKNPFAIRKFILGQSDGRMTSDRQASWSFDFRRKNAVVIDVQNVQSPGMFILNDQPLYWYAGALGETCIRFAVDPTKVEQFRRGSNELRFAPDPDYAKGAEEMIAGLSLYEAVENLTEKASWGFARWEPPQERAFHALEKSPRSVKGRPCWWRTTFTARDTALPMWFDTDGLSKGQVFVNGQNVGRYFTATADGKKVGPQTRLYIPEPWVKPGVENEAIIFDEHGFDPSHTRIEYNVEGEFG
jgi:hypothetical protein